MREAITGPFKLAVVLFFIQIIPRVLFGSPLCFYKNASWGGEGMFSNYSVEFVGVGVGIFTLGLAAVAFYQVKDADTNKGLHVFFAICMVGMAVFHLLTSVTFSVS
jgi:hypothetical protein